MEPAAAFIRGKGIANGQTAMNRLRIPSMEVPRHAALAVRSLGRFGSLSPGDEAEIRRCVADAELFSQNTEVLHEGEPLDRARILLSGWAAKVRLLGDGRRQILSFLVPGDTFGFAAGPHGVALCPTITMTPAIVGVVRPLSDAIAGRDMTDALAKIAWCMLLNDEACLLSQIVRVGRQHADERVAHFLLEIYCRLRSIGFVQGNRYLLPLTQEMLADTLGLSVVHINRTLQRLRRAQLIELHHSAVNILQPKLLAALADFRQPAHLPGLTMGGGAEAMGERATKPAG